MEDYNYDDADEGGLLSYGRSVRLTNPVNVKKLVDNTGTVIEVDDFAANERKIVEEELTKGIFTDPDFLKKLEEVGTFSDDEDDENDDLSIFEKKKKKMVPIIENMLYKRVISHGVGENTVPQGALAVFHYKFYSELNSEPFDASRCHGNGRPNRQRLGHGLIEGVDLAIETMRKKERSVFIISPEIFMGEMGCPPRVPGNVPIYAEIEIIDFIEKDAIEDYFLKTQEERSDLGCEDILRIAKQCRADGRAAFQQNRKYPALRKYMRAEDVLCGMGVKNDEEDEIRNKELSRVYCNISLIWFDLGHFVSSLKYANRTLDMEPNNVKALYRKGRALTAMGEYTQAACFLNRASQLNPTDNDIINAKLYNENQRKIAKSMEKEICEKMVNGSSFKDSNKVKTEERSPDLVLGNSTSNHLREMLHKFCNGQNRQKMVYPVSTLTQEEKKAVLDILAEFTNLDINSSSNSVIHITKRSGCMD